MWKTVFLFNIFVETNAFFQDSFMNRKKKHLFDSIFLYYKHVFTVCTIVVFAE